MEAVREYSARTQERIHGIRHQPAAGRAGQAIPGTAARGREHGPSLPGGDALKRHSFRCATRRIGIALHDAGKVLFPAELDRPGSQHEAAGERMLLEQGIAQQWPIVASHTQLGLLMA